MTEATPRQAVPIPPAMNRRWLNAVRVLSLLNVVMMCLFVLGWMMAFPIGLIPMGGFVWLVYSFTKKLHAQNPKKELALAAARG